MNYTDTLFNKLIGWIDQAFEMAKNYSSLLVYGVLAVMLAKLFKFKFDLKLGK